VIREEGEDDEQDAECADRNDDDDDPGVWLRDRSGAPDLEAKLASELVTA
jgi:hypothetical protein